MNRKIFSFVIAVFLALGLSVNSSAQEAEVTNGGATFTVDLSYSSQSAFKLFGETASTHSIATYDLYVEAGEWFVEVIVVDGIGKHNEGELADYYDGFILRTWEAGDFSGTYGTEIFYSPSQLGGEPSTFIAPQATATWAPSEYLLVELGVQYVGAHNTEYGGDRTFGWLSMTLSHKVGRVSASLTPGGVFGDTGRTTQWVAGTVGVDIRKPINLYVSYLTARSWDVPNNDEGGRAPIDDTWTFGVVASFGD